MALLAVSNEELVAYIRENAQNAQNTEKVVTPLPGPVIDESVEDSPEEVLKIGEG